MDGLDKHDSNLASLISLIQDLGSSQDVKILLSSRPLIEIERGFYNTPSLRLQDLTKGDIKIYIDARLRENQQFLESFPKKSQRKWILEVQDHVR